MPLFNCTELDHNITMKEVSIEKLHSKINEKQGRLYACFVDFRKAVDTVIHTGFKLKLLNAKGPFTPETRSTPALSRSGKMDGSAMSGPWSGRAYVGLKYSGGWSGPLWDVVVSGMSFSTGWKMVGDDPALHRSYVERGYSVVVGGTA